ncbi:adhesion domain-containing protein, partial [Pseudomonas sp. B3G-3]
STQAGSSTLKASINGSERTVETTFVRPPLIEGFIKPSTAKRTWSDANAYCTANGARLPTKDELQALWGQATVGRPSNSEMCSVHGWPLSGQCGGSSNVYWSSTPNGTGDHYYVNLNHGTANNTNDYDTIQVACVR